LKIEADGFQSRNSIEKGRKKGALILRLEER